MKCVKSSFGLNQAPPTPFTLRIGSLRFASENASVLENGFAYIYQWDKETVDWSVGEEVQLRLTMPDTPLTAVFENTPTTHDGETSFTFELRFSEEFDLSYKSLRGHAFMVTGGTVEKAQRMAKPSNIHWRITVQPDSNADVTITLPITEDCGHQGAICTQDGRRLSNRLELTVSGPDS